MTEKKTRKTTRTTTATESCSTGACSVVKAPTLADPFKPLGKGEADGVVTYSYAGVVGNDLYLKTVTVADGVQSEALVKLDEGKQIVPSSVEGYYKVI